MTYESVLVVSTDLRDTYVLQGYYDIGLTYIRQVHMPYNKILRSPTIGKYVELSSFKDIGSVPLNSKKGMHLINSNLYFS